MKIDDIQSDRPLRETLVNMSDTEKAELAGDILSEVDPVEPNLKAFWRALRSTVRDELESRVTDGDLEEEEPEDPDEDDDDDDDE